eukprot:8722946-Ditylum_brightwellii.AAC.1
MGNLFADLENVRAYIDDLLVITRGNWEDHLVESHEVLTRLSNAGLKKGRAGLIAPLSALTSAKAKWEWMDVHRTSF